MNRNHRISCLDGGAISYSRGSNAIAIRIELLQYIGFHIANIKRNSKVKNRTRRTRLHFPAEKAKNVQSGVQKKFAGPSRCAPRGDSRCYRLLLTSALSHQLLDRTPDESLSFEWYFDESKAHGQPD